MIAFVRKYFPFLLLAPALLPLLISGGLMYPYLVGKTLGFYALVLLMGAAFSILLFAGESFHFARLSSRLTWIPGVLLVLAYVTSYVGVDFYRSFWSLYVRGDGLLMLTCAAASFYLILLTATTSFTEKLFKTVAVVGSIVGVYGVGEWLFEGGRIGSLLGNAAFFAGYLGISLFVTLAVAPSLSRSWKLAAYWGAGFQVLSIVLTATRGTMLALAGAGLVFLFHRAVTAPQKEKRNFSWGILGLLFLVAVSFVVFRAPLSKVAFTPVARIASASASDNDIASRLFIWKNMLQKIGEHPLLGVGAEHIDTVFNTFYDPTQIEEEWFDRSHNAYFDYAVQYGVGGALLYLGLILTFLYAALRYRPHHKWAGEMLFLGGLTYAVQNFFVFDTVSSFWLFLALLAVLLATHGTPSAPSSIQRRSLPLGMVGALIFIALIIPTTILPLIANHDLFEAYLYHVSDVALANQYFSKGLALHTYGDIEYGYEAYDMYTAEQATLLSGANRVAGYVTARNILTSNFTQYPYDARTALYLAHVLALAPPEEKIDVAEERAAIERTLAFSPKRAEGWLLLANLSINEANTNPPASALRNAGYAKAISTLNAYVLLVPTFSETHFVLAELYLGQGDKIKAAEEAAKGKAFYTKENFDTAVRAAGYYEGAEDWADAAFFLGEVVRMHPNDYVSWYDLAKTKYLAGDKPGALKIVLMLRVKNPAILATDAAFNSAIQAYEQSTK